MLLSCVRKVPEVLKCLLVVVPEMWLAASPKKVLWRKSGEADQAVSRTACRRE